MTNATCHYAFNQGCELACLNDYSACPGRTNCRYPELHPERKVGKDSGQSVKPKLHHTKLHHNPALLAVNKQYKGHPLYQLWASLCHSCYNPRSKNYGQLGSKLLEVWPTWHYFENFIQDFPDYRGTDTFVLLDPERPYSPDNYVLRRGQDLVYAKSWSHSKT